MNKPFVSTLAGVVAFSVLAIAPVASAETQVGATVSASMNTYNEPTMIYPTYGDDARYSEPTPIYPTYGDDVRTGETSVTSVVYPTYGDDARYDDSRDTKVNADGSEIGVTASATGEADVSATTFFTSLLNLFAQWSLFFGF